MRIPTYTSQQGVNLSQLNTPQVASVDLSPALGAVQNQVEIANREKEEVKKVATEVERQKTGLEIDKKYAEIVDRISSGGSYSKAKKEFDDFYNKTVRRSVGTFGDDKLTAQRAMLDYERQGFSYGLKIQSAMKSRAKSDAIAAANQRMAGYEREFFNAETPEAQAEIIQKFNNTTSSLEASGIIDDGKQRLQKFISDGIRNKATHIAQENPTAGLAMVEQYKDALDVKSYVALRGTLKKAVDNYDFSNEVEDFIRGGSINEPTQAAIDGHLEDVNRQLEVGQVDDAIYEQKISSAISSTGVVPTGLKQQISTLFAMSPDEINVASAASVARSARIVSSAAKSNAGLINRKDSGIDKTQRIISDMIVKKTNRGVDEMTAVRETLRKFNDPAFSSVYDDAKKDVMKLSGNKYQNFYEELQDGLDIENPGLVMNDAVDIYATAIAGGASAGEATEQAVEQLKGRYGKFNGIDVEMPPHMVTSFQDEQTWIDMAQPIIDAHFPELKGRIKPALSGDSVTRRDIQSGKKSSEIRFRLNYMTEGGLPVPLHDRETGHPLYVQATPEMKSLSEKIIDISNEFGFDPVMYQRFLNDRGIKDSRANTLLVRSQFVNSDYHIE